MEKSGEKENNIDFDRLSALPDDIICHILSFLPTWSSVSTSVLARRWRFIWAHVPILDFECEDHLTWTSFSNMVTAVMSQHQAQSTHTFRLNLKGINSCREYDFETLITTVIDHNVQNLVLCPHYQFMLPQRLFTCNTLVHLSLQYCRTIPITGTAAYLPALKKLHLDRVTYESDESLPHLLSCCPVLEELFIWRIGSDMIFCHISSPTLNRLFMFHSSFWETRNKGYRLKLDTPALKYLKLEDYDNVSAGVLTSLVEANVTFHAWTDELEFVGRLCNVKDLTLSTGWIGDSAAFSTFTIKFHNLAKLKLEGANWRFISYFLENADNLEVLTIVIVEECLIDWADPKQVPACLLSHLQTVRIHNFECTEQEFSMVRYILRNAKVLKRMEIDADYFGDYLEVQKRISLLDRGSEACQLAFYSEFLSPVLEEFIKRGNEDNMICCYISLPTLNTFLMLNDFESKHVSAGALTSSAEANVTFHALADL